MVVCAGNRVRYGGKESPNWEWTGRKKAEGRREGENGVRTGKEVISSGGRQGHGWERGSTVGKGATGNCRGRNVLAIKGVG